MVTAKDYKPGNQTAEVIANLEGRVVPDRYSSGDDEYKMQDAHAKMIHNPYERYGGDSPEGDGC
jgi:hypothetical protein